VTSHPLSLVHLFLLQQLAIEGIKIALQNHYFRGKLPVSNLLTARPKIRFFVPQGRLVALIHVKLGRARGSAWICKISPKSPQAVGIRPKNIKNFHFLVNSCGATPLTDFENFQGILYAQLSCIGSNLTWFASQITELLLRNCASVNYAEFFRSPCRKTALDRKMNNTFFDGLDELYHHSKFGEDRTTRAGCRCENVVFVTFFLSFTLGVRSAVRSRGA